MQITESLGSSRTLFVTTLSPYGAAAKVTLKQWFTRVLQDAGVEASPRLSNAAGVSTVLVRGVVKDSVMRAADWASTCTLFANNIRLLPAETLGVAYRSFQLAL